VLRVVCDPERPACAVTRKAVAQWAADSSKRRTARQRFGREQGDMRRRFECRDRVEAGSFDTDDRDDNWRRTGQREQRTDRAVITMPMRDRCGRRNRLRIVRVRMRAVMMRAGVGDFGGRGPVEVVAGVSGNGVQSRVAQQGNPCLHHEDERRQKTPDGHDHLPEIELHEQLSFSDGPNASRTAQRGIANSQCSVGLFSLRKFHRGIPSQTVERMLSPGSIKNACSSGRCWLK
jgi:hypothetical protein